MILSWAIGSDGAVDESFTLRVPIELSPLNTLKVGAEKHEFTLLGRRATLSEESPYHVLEIYGFETENEARECLKRLPLALVSTGLTLRLGMLFDPQDVPVRLHPSPLTVNPGSLGYGVTSTKGWDTVEGDYDFDATTIRPEHRRLVRFGVGRSQGRSTYPVDGFTRALGEALERDYPERRVSREKLLLSYEVYSQSFFEISSHARFLTLVMSLEAVLPDEESSQPVRDLADSFFAQARQQQDECDSELDPALKREYESLVGRLKDLKRKSIGQGMRALVRKSLASDPNAARVDEVVKEMATVYKLRSRLVHDGTVNDKALSKALSYMNDVVPRVLQGLLWQAG